MPKGKKVAEPAPPPPVDDDDDDDDEEEEEEQPTTREEEEDEGAAPDGEEDGDRVRRLRRSRRNAREKALQNGVRAYATQAGAGIGVFGSDHAKTVFAPSDVKRLAQWCPQTPSDAFMSNEQFETHLALRDEPLSTAPLDVLTSAVESFARKIVGELVMRHLEATGQTKNEAQTKITAANVRSVLRPYMPALHMSNPLLPHGLVRVAQTIAKGESEDTVLPATDETREAMAAERKSAKDLQTKLLKNADKRIAARKTARAAKRKRPDAEPAAAVAVA